MRGRLAFVLLVGILFSVTPIEKNYNIVKAKSLEINIFLPGADSNINVLSNFESDLGIKFNSAKFYLDWTDDFPTNIAQRFHSHDAIPEAAWQPQIGHVGVKYQDVLNGDYDNYLDDFAEDVESLNFDIRISLAPEMNGDWAPWGVGNNGNTPQDFILFWRYVVDRFSDKNVDNVEWIWSPNVHYWGEKYSYASMFPGNDYIDYLGVEGYNWGTSQSWSEWQSFRQVFSSSYQDLIKLSTKSILITETASTERGGDKASWIKSMFSDLNNIFPQVKGLTWFNINKETDWRIESSLSSKKAFIAGALNFSAPPKNRKNYASIFTTPIENNNNLHLKHSTIRAEKVKPLAMIVVADNENNLDNFQKENPNQLSVSGGQEDKNNFIDIIFWTLWSIALILTISLLIIFGIKQFSQNGKTIV